MKRRFSKSSGYAFEIDGSWNLPCSKIEFQCAFDTYGDHTILTCPGEGEWDNRYLEKDLQDALMHDREELGGSGDG